jgi:hypothetical protein
MIKNTVLQLKRLPIFAGQVIDALGIPDLKDYEMMTPPVAIVVPLGTRAEENHSRTDTYQIIHKSVGIICVLSNAAGVTVGTDRRGSAVAEQVDQLEASLMRALLNWNPYNPVEIAALTPAFVGYESGDPLIGHTVKGFQYDGCAFIQQEYDLSRSIYQFNFSIPVWITGQDGFEPTGVPLEEITFTATSQRGDDPLFKIELTDLQDVGEALEGVVAHAEAGGFTIA